MCPGTLQPGESIGRGGLGLLACLALSLIAAPAAFSEAAQTAWHVQGVEGGSADFAGAAVLRSGSRPVPAAPAVVELLAPRAEAPVSSAETDDESEARFAAAVAVTGRSMRRAMRGSARRFGGGPDLSTCCPRGPPGAA